MKNRRRAFTLTEMLAAIAILALVVGLLVPGLMQALHFSRQTRCMMQLKQIAAELAAYAADNEGVTTAQFDPAIRYNWQQILARWDGTYASLNGSSNCGVWRCPENTHQRTVTWGNNIGEAYNSYTLNGNGNTPAYNEYTSQKIGSLLHPSQLYMVFEGVWNQTRSFLGNDGYQSAPTTNQGVEQARYPHRRGMNMIYADGHGELLPAPVENVGSRLTSGYTISSFSNGIHWQAN